MIKYILAFLISPLLGLTSCMAYALLISWLDTNIVRPYLALPPPEDDLLLGPALALISLTSLLTAYFLAAVAGIPSVFLLTRLKRDSFKAFALSGLGLGLVLGLGLALLIMQPGEAIWYWLLVISFPTVGSLVAYIACWLIAIK